MRQKEKKGKNPCQRRMGLLTVGNTLGDAEARGNVDEEDSQNDRTVTEGEPNGQMSRYVAMVSMFGLMQELARMCAQTCAI